MKISLLIASLFLISFTSASNETSTTEMRDNVVLTDVLESLLTCIVSGLTTLTGENLTPVLLQLGGTLGSASVCLEGLDPNNVQGVVGCLLRRLNGITSNQLREILIEVGPLLLNVRPILACVLKLLKVLCGGCGPMILACTTPEMIYRLGLLDLVLNLLINVLSGIGCRLV